MVAAHNKLCQEQVSVNLSITSMPSMVEGPSSDEEEVDEPCQAEPPKLPC